jgi:toxin YoeB
MIIAFHPTAWDDYLYWQQNDKAMLRRVNALIRDIQQKPYAGIGKPEALKFNLLGYWSRRIDDEHRIVYKVIDDDLIIAQLRGHYD